MFYIHSVDVISEYQSKGIGTRLMEFTLDYIKKENEYGTTIIINKYIYDKYSNIRI